MQWSQTVKADVYLCTCTRDYRFIDQFVQLYCGGLTKNRLSDCQYWFVLVDLFCHRPSDRLRTELAANGGLPEVKRANTA